MRSCLARLAAGFEGWVANLCLILLVLVLALQVFARYVFDIGISWSEEVSRFAFIWFTYISTSLAVQRSTHVRITIVVELLPAALAPVARAIADALWVSFNALVIVSGCLLVARMLRHPVYSTSLFLPLAYVYTIIPLAHALMILRLAQTYWRRPRGSAESEASP